MGDKLMYIPNDDIQNYPFCNNYWFKRLDAQLNEPTNQNSIKVHKVIELKNIIINFGD